MPGNTIINSQSLLSLQYPDEMESNYVWLGLGQSYIKIGETDKTKNALVSAYMLEGTELFLPVKQDILFIRSTRLLATV
jgi:hypothetical protein